MQTGSKFVLLQQQFCWCQTKYYMYKKISKWNSVKMIMKRFRLHVVVIFFYFPIPWYYSLEKLDPFHIWICWFQCFLCCCCIFVLTTSYNLILREISLENQITFNVFIKQKLCDDKSETKAFVNARVLALNLILVTLKQTFSDEHCKREENMERDVCTLFNCVQACGCNAHMKQKWVAAN